MAPLIRAVENNKQKQANYQKLMTGYRTAIDKGFYAEAELIVYAFIEDRLRSLLFYVGATNTWNSQSLSDDVTAIVGQVSSLNNMETKIDVLRKLIKATRIQTVASPFATASANKFTKEQKTLLLATFKKIDKWRSFRNEIVHAIFNKDLDELTAKFRGHVEEGYALGRTLDSVMKRKKSSPISQ